MPQPFSRLAVVGFSAFAAAGLLAALPAEAGKKFKPSFALKLPGEPKGAASMKAATSGPTAAGTGFVYNDDIGSIAINGIKIKAGLTTVMTHMNVNIFAGLDLTGVTFPVTQPAGVALSYSKTTIKLSDPMHPKILAYSYGSGGPTQTMLTVDSYDPVAGTITGSLSGTVVYLQNEQDPSDDARDGTVVTLTNAKFALRKLN